MPPANFRSHKTWQKAHELTLRVYEVSRTFPREELVGLTSHMRRLAGTVASRIVEAIGIDNDSEINMLLRSAGTSISELEYHLLLAHDLHYFDEATYNSLAEDVSELRRAMGSFQTRVRANR